MILDETIRRQSRYGGHIYGIIEIPLLAEQPDFQRNINGVLLVEADEQTRIVRVMRRSGLPEEQVRQFVAAQADDRQRRRLAGEILLNNGSTQELRQKIGRLNPLLPGTFPTLPHPGHHDYIRITHCPSVVR